MSDMEITPAQQKARKKKLIILGVLVAGSGLTWARTLLGGDDGKPPVAPPADAAAAAPAGAAVVNAAAPAGASAVANSRIADFETAMERIELWSAALNRQAHQGPITAPEQGFDDSVFSESLEPEEETEEVVEPPIVLQPEPEQEAVPFAALGLELSSTYLFGSSHWAVIDRQRSTSGQQIVVRHEGRDVSIQVVAVRSRSVDLEYRGEVHTLRMTPPDLETVEVDQETQPDAQGATGS